MLAKSDIKLCGAKAEIGFCEAKADIMFCAKCSTGKFKLSILIFM
jgi:hypothetical protein